MIIGFFLNRIFDIFKPYPIRKIEELHGGFGIMLDDVLAGVYANLFLRLIIILLTVK
jgi:phosphatidylglycerophosphatase A